MPKQQPQPTTPIRRRVIKCAGAPKKEKQRRRRKGRDTPWNKHQMEFDKGSKALDVKRSLLNYILYVGLHFMDKDEGDVRPYSQFMDPLGCGGIGDELKTWQGDSQFAHLLLWAKLGWIDHWAYPIKDTNRRPKSPWNESDAQRERRIEREHKLEERRENDERRTIYGIWNFEEAYDDGYWFKMRPDMVKNKDGTPFDFSKYCNGKALSEVRGAVKVMSDLLKD